MATTQPTIKGGNIILREFRLPESIRPGESVTAEIKVSNGAIGIGPFDPDRCGGINPGEGEGYKVRAVLVHPDGTKQRSDTDCLKKTAIGTKDETYSVTFTAPEATETHYYSAYVEMVGSGKTTDSVDDTLTVSETTPERPEDPSDGDENGGSLGLWGDAPDAPDVPDAPDGSDLLGGNVKVIGTLLVVVAIVAAVGGAT
jgi:hypothetical protein